jgi:hypothetical protein
VYTKEGAVLTDEGREALRRGVAYYLHGSNMYSTKQASGEGSGVF